MGVVPVFDGMMSPPPSHTIVWPVIHDEASVAR